MSQEATYQTVEFAPGRTMTLETGRLAKQAGGAVVVRLGDTMVLCTAVLSNWVKEGQSFFPLTVDYREKFASGGKIPGGYGKSVKIVPPREATAESEPNTGTPVGKLA